MESELGSLQCHEELPYKACSGYRELRISQIDQPYLGALNNLSLYALLWNCLTTTTEMFPPESLGLRDRAIVILCT